MIVLFTDFGLAGPYTGQMKAVLAREAPAVPVIDLFADAPSHDPRAASYLLAAYAAEFPRGTVFLCVVDPGVGGARKPVIVEADGRLFVGPGNGLFEMVMRRARRHRGFEIVWRPRRLSSSFHGRDLFAPVAAALARAGRPAEKARPAALVRHRAWPDDLAEIVYIDRYGNAMTGLRPRALPKRAILHVAGRELARARTFGGQPPGQPFWYENANGLVEIAVNRGRAADFLGLRVGSPARIEAAAKGKRPGVRGLVG